MSADRTSRTEVADAVEKAQRPHDDEVEIVDPLLSLEDRENERRRRDQSIARLRLIWSHRSFLGRVAGVSLVAATIIAFLIPKRFTSTARLMPPDESNGPTMGMLAALAGKAGSSLGGLGNELLGLKTTGELFVGILQSRTVEDDLIARFDLRKAYGDKRWEDARKELSRNTGISIDQRSGILSLAVTDKSPQKSAAMAQEYVAELNHTVAELNTSSAHRERIFLESRLNEVQQNLQSAEKQFSEFASKNTAIDIQEQGKAMIEAGATLEGQLIAAQTELEGLRQIFSDNNVRVRETQARVDELRRQLQKLGGKGYGAERTDRQDQDGFYPSVRELPLLGVGYADLYRRMKVQEAVFETLTQQYELAKVEEAKETPSVSVLDPPNIPETKSYPPRLLVAVGGTVFVEMLAIAWLLGKAKWKGTDALDPRKAFISEVFDDVYRSLGRPSTNKL